MTPRSLAEQGAEGRLRFSEIKVGQTVCIYAPEVKPFDPKTIAEERKGQPTAPIDEPRPLPVASLKKVHEGEATKKTDTYFSIGGVTVLKKDIERGAVVIRPSAKKPLSDRRE